MQRATAQLDFDTNKLRTLIADYAGIEAELVTDEAHFSDDLGLDWLDQLELMVLILAAALVPLSFLLLAARPTDAKAREEKVIPPLPIPHVARTAGAHPSRPQPRSQPAPIASAHAAPPATPIPNKNALVPIND
jgi:hypothetical protein